MSSNEGSVARHIPNVHLSFSFDGTWDVVEVLFLIQHLVVMERDKIFSTLIYDFTFLLPAPIFLANEI